MVIEQKLDAFINNNEYIYQIATVQQMEESISRL